MSGINGDQDEEKGPRITDGPDPCKKKRLGPINSPKATVLSKLSKGAVLDVRFRCRARRILDAKVNSGSVGGSLRFSAILKYRLIQNAWAQYKGTITNVSGGVYEVRVEPV